MTKIKNTFIGIGSVLLICIASILLIHNKWTDRINPFISQTTSYAKVQKGTQSYDNLQAVDPKTGKNLPYRLDHVGGYDPSREYISINHKGQYVKEITYISKNKYEQAQK